MHFCQRDGMWSKSNIEFVVETQPFSEGSFRHAFHAKMYDTSGRVRNYVCKFAKDLNTPRDLYYNDIKAQVFASIWAQKFNDFHPPKNISYVECFVLELVERPGRPLCGCEEFVEGDFKKHNNNVGAVGSWVPETPDQKIDIQLAQAFSHFTYEHSKCQILICDIQGVGEIYTDPQVHTLSGKGFGGGNLGITGIKAFLLRHQCNEVCSQMNLPRIEAKFLADNLNRSDTPGFPLADELENFQDDSSKRLYVKRNMMTIGRGSNSQARTSSPSQNMPARRLQMGHSESQAQLIDSQPTSPASRDEIIEKVQNFFDKNAEEREKSLNDVLDEHERNTVSFDAEEEQLMASILRTDFD
jgi:hypothetical protein